MKKKKRNLIPPEYPLMSNIISQRNKNLNWVDRGLHPNNYPIINNPDGSYSTHKLGYVTGDDGEAYVYPTIIQDESGNLVDLKNKGWNYAKRTNTAIRIPNVKLADYYSKNGLIKHYRRGGIIPPSNFDTAQSTVDYYNKKYMKQYKPTSDDSILLVDPNDPNSRIDVPYEVIKNINHLSRIGNLDSNQKLTLAAIAMQESKFGTNMSFSGLYGAQDLGNEMKPDRYGRNVMRKRYSGTPEENLIKFIMNKTNNFTNVDNYHSKHTKMYGYPYSEAINNNINLINTNETLKRAILGVENPEAAPDMPVKYTYKRGGQVDDPPYESQRQWMLNWLSNPETTKRLIKNADLSKTKLYKTKGIRIQEIDNPTLEQKAGKITNIAKKKVSTVGIEYKYKPNSDWAGLYHPDKNTIEINTDGDGNVSNTIAHELGHSTNLTNVFSNFINKYNRNKLNPDEVYSDIWGLRRQINIQPGQTIDSNTINKIRNNSNLMFDNDRLFNNFNDTEIMELMNGLSKNNSKKQYVAKGGKILKPQRKVIGGIISAATQLYDAGYNLGNSMVEGNKNEYGLIDSNTANANQMQANLVFDPAGHIATVFGSGGSWEDLGYWGGKKAAAEDDKKYAKIKAMESNAEKQAKLQIGRYGASTYNQYGYPTSSMYRRGGQIGDPPNGIPLKGKYIPKGKRYWDIVHAQGEVGIPDHLDTEFAINPARVYNIEAAPGQAVHSEFYGGRKYNASGAGKLKEFYDSVFNGYQGRELKNMTKDQLIKFGKMAGNFLNSIVPGVEDMPLSPLATPGYKNTFTNTNLKCGGKAKRMKKAGGGMIPVKLDHNEIVYDQFGNPAPIITNSKIGMKAGGTHIRGGKGGTDKVNAMLPEGSVVISDDNGEVDKLSRTFRMNPSKQVINTFMNRAINKQNGNNKGLYLGGLSNPWDNSPMYDIKHPNLYGYNNPNKLYTGFRYAKADPYKYYNINIPSSTNYQNASSSMPIKKPSVNIPNITQRSVTPGFQLDNPGTNTLSNYDYSFDWPDDKASKKISTVDKNGNVVNRKGKDIQSPSTMKTLFNGEDTLQTIGTIGEGVLGIANTIVNASAYNKLKKLPYYKYTPGRYFEQDPRYMRSFFNEAKSGLDQSTLNSMEGLRRGISGGALGNYYNSLNANLLKNKSGLAAQESATIGDILNKNAASKSEFYNTEAIRKMYYDAGRMQHKMGLINTKLALNQNTIDTLQGFTNNLKNWGYQNKQLAYMRDALMLPERLPGETMEEYRKRSARITLGQQ